MNKCIGCGALTEKADYCERCFRIKHYNEYKQVELKDKDFIEVINNIKSDELALLIVDVMDIPQSFEIFNHLKNVVLVLTKRDLLPSSIKDEKLFYHMDCYKFNFTDKIIISSNKNYNFDKLYEMINEYKKSNNVYVIGFTNSGKSTMLNKFIHNYADEARELTTSMLPSTTLDMIEIKINETLTLIDTPGIIDSGSVSFHLSKEMLKKLVLKKPLRPITYQIKTKQHIKIEDFFIVEFQDKNDATLYVSNHLLIDRVFDEVKTDMIKKEIFIEYGSDLVIKGLGFINIKKRCTVTVYVKEGIEVFARTSLI